MKVPETEVITASGQWSLEISALWTNGADILWSPDSRFLAMTGSLNDYTESTRVFEITDSGPKSLDPLLKPSQDLVQRFPPCHALRIDPSMCKEHYDEDEFNFAAVAWADAHTLVLMSEVPCHSLMGGIMCQVMGYEVDLESGAIVNSMTAREFKKRWQHAMAWRFHIPEPPAWQN